MTDYERGRADALAEAVKVVENHREHDRILCCDGRECGCRGASVFDLLVHQIRALSTSPADHVLVPREGAMERMAKAIYETKGHCYMDETRMFVPVPWEDADEIMRAESSNEAEAAFRAMIATDLRALTTSDRVSVPQWVRDHFKERLKWADGDGMAEVNVNTEAIRAMIEEAK